MSMETDREVFRGLVEEIVSNMELGQVPRDLLEITCDAIDIVSPNVLALASGPESGPLVCWIAMEITAVIRAAEKQALAMPSPPSAKASMGE